MATDPRDGLAFAELFGKNVNVGYDRDVSAPGDIVVYVNAPREGYVSFDAGEIDWSEVTEFRVGYDESEGGLWMAFEYGGEAPHGD